MVYDGKYISIKYMKDNKTIGGGFIPIKKKNENTINIMTLAGITCNTKNCSNIPKKNTISMADIMRQ